MKCTILFWRAPIGSGCTFPLPDEKSGELHCHPSREQLLTKRIIIKNANRDIGVFLWSKSS